MRKTKKRIKIPKPENLANSALYYLSRFAASEESLRRVLQNRIRRAALAHPDFAADKNAQKTLASAIDAIVAQHKKSGALNDEAFAAMKVRSLRREGRSKRRIEMQLRQKGVAAEIIESALEPDEETGDPERKAALAFAKKRKLGPYRPPALIENHKEDKKQEATQRRKDYATMARAGFSYDTSRATLGGELPDDE
jgi:regulatory protein